MTPRINPVSMRSQYTELTLLKTQAAIFQVITLKSGSVSYDARLNYIAQNFGLVDFESLIEEEATQAKAKETFGESLNIEQTNQKVATIQEDKSITKV